MPHSTIQQTYPAETLKPVAYISLSNVAVRTRVISILEDAGWTTSEEPTGFHLLGAIADVIEGSRPWLRPSLIVIDAFSRGCAGTTIALGLRDLGITIPIVLALAPGQPSELIASSNRMLHVVEPDSAERVVKELARSPFAMANELLRGPAKSSSHAA